MLPLLPHVLPVFYASSGIVSTSNVGSDPSESIQVIGIIIVVDLKMTDPLERAWVTLDGFEYSIDQGGRVSSCGMWCLTRTIKNRNCNNEKREGF